MQVASGLCHSAFRETWSPSTVFFSRRNALGTLVLSTDIQIQEKFFLGALASLIHVEGVSVISRLKIASKRALYCFRLSEQCQQCQSYRANDWRWCFDSTFLHCALIKLFSSVLWFDFSTVCFDSSFQHRTSMSSLPPFGGISSILFHWDWDKTESGSGILPSKNKLARL